MGVEGMVNWKGDQIDKKKHGGNRAASFIYFMVVMENIAFVSNMINLVTYFHGVMHMGLATSSTTVTNFVGASCAFALLGGFLSDSYITRFTTILIFGPLTFLVVYSLFLLLILDNIYCTKERNDQQVRGIGNNYPM